MHLWWQVLDEICEGMVNRFGINHVVVVEDEDEMVRDGGALIKQSSQNRFGWWWLRGLERTQHASSNGRRYRLQSSDEVGQKECRVAIPFAQRQPGHLLVAPGHPCADQRGFPDRKSTRLNSSHPSI